MTLTKWITLEGGSKVARSLDVSLSRVSHWKSKRVLPTPKLMKRIVSKSKKQVTYKEMIEDFLRYNK